MVSNNISRLQWGNLHDINITCIMHDLRDLLSVMNANILVYGLNHCGLVTLYVFRGLGQHLFR